MDENVLVELFLLLDFEGIGLYITCGNVADFEGADVYDGNVVATTSCYISIGAGNSDSVCTIHHIHIIRVPISDGDRFSGGTNVDNDDVVTNTSSYICIGAGNGDGA